MSAATEKRNTFRSDGETYGNTCFVNTKPKPQTMVTKASKKYKTSFYAFALFYLLRRAASPRSVKKTITIISYYKKTQLFCRGTRFFLCNLLKAAALFDNI